MHQRIPKLISHSILANLLLVILLVTVSAALKDQHQTKIGKSQFDESQYPTVEEYTPNINVPEERLKSDLKAKRFRMDMPATSNPNFKVAAAVYHWPLGFSALPVSESTTILVGDVIKAKANLSEDRRAVYSDFTIDPVSVLKDTCNVAKNKLTASRYGGRVKFQDGNTLLVFKSGLGMPRVGRRYLFFLKQTDADSELLTGYEIDNGKAIPLDTGTPNFDIYRNVSEASLLNEVRQKIASQERIAFCYKRDG